MKKTKKKEDNIIYFKKGVNKLERQIEAILFAAEEPLDIETIEKRVQSKQSIQKILEKLQNEYTNRGINLVCFKNKWSFRTPENLTKLMSLQKSTERKLSRATLETLAIIVYHQPVTRSEIEEIRGVAFATNTLEILFELEWVRPAGRKDVPGKPIQYATTDNFLAHFNIQKLTDLPTVDELSTAGLIDSSTIDSSIFGTGKFYKEQLSSKKEDIYSDIEKAIDESPKNKE
jgi:segregation and condensation protein B